MYDVATRKTTVIHFPSLHKTGAHLHADTDRDLRSLPVPRHGEATPGGRKRKRVSHEWELDAKHDVWEAPCLRLISIQTSPPMQEGRFTTLHCMT